MGRVRWFSLPTVRALLFLVAFLGAVAPTRAQSAAELKEKLSTVEASQAELEKKLSTTEASRAELEKKLSTTEARLTTFEEQLDASSKENEKLTAAIQVHAADIVALKDQAQLENLWIVLAVALVLGVAWVLKSDMEHQRAIRAEDVDLQVLRKVEAAKESQSLEATRLAERLLTVALTGVDQRISGCKLDPLAPSAAVTALEKRCDEQHARIAALKATVQKHQLAIERLLQLHP